MNKQHHRNKMRDVIHQHCLRCLMVYTQMNLIQRMNQLGKECIFWNSTHPHQIVSLCHKLNKTYKKIHCVLIFFISNYMYRSLKRRCDTFNCLNHLHESLHVFCPLQACMLLIIVSMPLSRSFTGIFRKYSMPLDHMR